MAALLPTTSYVVALGPIKAEIVEFTGTVTIAAGGGTQTGFSSADTFTSKLVRPVMVFPYFDVNGGDNSSTSISGKTITVTNTGVSNQTFRAVVIGF